MRKKKLRWDEGGILLSLKARQDAGKVSAQHIFSLRLGGFRKP